MITRLNAVTHKDLPGIQMFLIDPGNLPEGLPQRLLVQMAPGSRIPTHRHTVDATMDVFGGTATVVSDDADNGVEVVSGNRVHFPAHRPHGFNAGPEGFTFLSTNGVIVGPAGEWNMEFATP